MADNVILDPGVGGATCATDDVGGVHYQKVKLDVGGDGLTVPVVGALPISAVALPLPTGAATEASLAALNAKVTAVNTGAVTIAASGLPTGAATEATLGTIHGHVDSIDGKITACNTGAVAGSVTANAGTNLNTSALALEAGGNLADIKTAVQVIDNCISGSEAQVDVVAALPAGTNLLGKIGIDQVTANANEVVVKSGTITAVTTITNAVAITNADITSCKTALELLDNSVDGNYLNVNQNIAGTDVASGAGAVNAQVQRVTHASDDPAVTALQIIDNMISGSEAQVDVVASLPAGTNLIGDVAIGPRATGGGTGYSYISDGTDLVNVTDGQTTLYAISCTSTDATVIYIKFYNKATAPDPSAETPVLRFAVPSMATGAGFVWSIPQGIDFATGLGFALVTGAADTDETAVTANEVMVNLVYKH
jgi:hypothetical protein